MWKQTAKEFTDAEVGKEDKQQQQIDSADSGFLSSGNLMSSEISIDCEEEEQKEEGKIAPEPARAIDSGLNLGLADSLSQLSLKEDVVAPLDSGTIDPETEDLSAEDFKNEEVLEPWEIYYTQNDDGDTQLHLSIIQRFLEASFFLINLAPHPCLFNIFNDDWQTALHLAVLTNQPKVVRRLILAGADPNVRNFKGNTPLHIACATGDINCAKALTSPFTAGERTWLKPGQCLPPLPQNLEQRNYDGEMCIHIAAKKGHKEIIHQLLRLGADLEAREGLAGRTALHLAIEHRQRELVGFLVRECRAPLESRTYAGLTPYHTAIEVDAEIAEELVRLGAVPSRSPNETDSEEDSEYDEEDADEDDDGAREAAYRDVLARFNIKPTSSTGVV